MQVLADCETNPSDFVAGPGTTLAASCSYTASLGSPYLDDQLMLQVSAEDMDGASQVNFDGVRLTRACVYVEPTTSTTETTTSTTTTVSSSTFWPLRSTTAPCA